MTATADAEVTEAAHQLTKMWWIFLVTGIAWVLISLVLLSWDPGTTKLIGYMAGFVLIAAGANELVSIGFASSWKWVHGAMGAVFIIAGIFAFMEPFQTFGILALLIGWFLLFKGVMDTIISIVERDALHLWGLLLASGIVQIAIGVWAIGYPGRSAWLLVIWIGIGALMRGITEIVFAFKMRDVHNHPNAPLATA